LQPWNYLPDVPQPQRAASPGASLALQQTAIWRVSNGSIGAIKLRDRHGGTCFDCGRRRGVARPSTVGHITCSRTTGRRG